MPKTFPVVGLHLDLKYLMPRKQYLLRWLREIKECGINTLLLEYEDKFPWQKYPFLQEEGAFTPEELREFLTTARGLGLRIVPLVQTLSHLEFALAHEELAHLREMPHITTQINPSNPDALTFVTDLIDEVLTYHQEDEWFHIGADETWFLGTNPEYSDEVKSMGVPAYWARHTRKFVDKMFASGKRPIVWDDVLWRGLPEPVAPDFPQQTILAAWDYGKRKFEPGMYPQVDLFQKAGFDVLGVPCLNWGVLTPQHDHNLENTQTWTQKARESDMLGVINSSWACFHTPLPTHMLYVAATAALLEDGRSEIDTDWQVGFLQEYFGAPAQDVPEALLNLGTMWEHKVGMARPISPIVYGYMDMMLHYAGGTQERKERGVYPRDWGEVDFNDIFRKKMDLLRNDPDQTTLKANLTELRVLYDQAEAVLRELAASATKHQQEAKLLALFAHTKASHTRAVEYLVFGEDDGAGLATIIATQETPLREILPLFYEPVAVERFLLALWQPPAQELADMVK